MGRSKIELSEQASLPAETAEIDCGATDIDAEEIGGGGKEGPRQGEGLRPRKPQLNMITGTDRQATKNKSERPEHPSHGEGQTSQQQHSLGALSNKDKAPAAKKRINDVTLTRLKKQPKCKRMCLAKETQGTLPGLA